jgi:hypothetical protein
MGIHRVKLGNEPQNPGNTGKKLKFTGKKYPYTYSSGRSMNYSCNFLPVFIEITLQTGIDKASIIEEPRVKMRGFSDPGGILFFTR